MVWSSGILCSGTQQGISSTQAGQTLQIQPNIRKYNKHTATESECKNYKRIILFNIFENNKAIIQF